MSARSSSVLARGLIVCAVLLGVPSAEAIPTSELLSRSRAAAQRGDWNTSARSLEELVAAGVDDNTVLYDLGTAYANAGRYGEAIWRLEQVVRRQVFDGDAQHNLRATRLRLAHRDAERSGRAVAETSLPLKTALAEVLPMDSAVALAVLAQLAVIASLWLARKRKGEAARIGGVASAALAGAIAAFALAVLVARTSVEPASIVLRDGVRLLNAPAEDAIAGESVREGERVVFVEKQGTFARVRTVEGKVGWVRARDVGALD
jgi:hypothetical protein